MKQYHNPCIHFKNATVQNFLCSPDTFVTQRSDKTDPPVKIDFFICADSGHLLSRIEVCNMFSIFDMSSMDDMVDVKVFGRTHSSLSLPLSLTYIISTPFHLFFLFLLPTYVTFRFPLYFFHYFICTE